MESCEKRFDEIRKLFQNKGYIDATKKTEELIRSVLEDIYREVYSDLPKKIQESVDKEMIRIGGEGNPIKNFSFNMMVDLFESTKLLDKLKGENPKFYLIKSFNLGQIAELITFCRSEENLDQYRDEEDIIKFCVQQLILYLAALLSLRNELKLTPYEFLTNPEEIKGKVEEIKEMVSEWKGRMDELGREYRLKLDRDKDVDYRVFYLLKKRGLLINPRDDRRNVSLKVDTFDNLLSQLHDRIIERCQPKGTAGDGDGEKMKEIAKQIIYEAGRFCGARFGRSLYDQFQKEPKMLSFEEKIDHWCKFDSDIGFGRFINEVKVDKANNVAGSVILYDNFLTVNKDKNAPNLCSLMIGYINGVVETVLRLPIKVIHDKNDCEQYVPYKSQCEFHIWTSLFGLKSKYKQYLKDGPVNAELINVFKSNKRSLSSNTIISKIDEKNWEIVDKKADKNKKYTYRIKDTGEQLNVYLSHIESI